MNLEGISEETKTVKTRLPSSESVGGDERRSAIKLGSFYTLEQNHGRAGICGCQFTSFSATSMEIYCPLRTTMHREVVEGISDQEDSNW